MSSRPKFDPDRCRAPVDDTVDRDKVSAYDRLTHKRAEDERKPARMPRYPKVRLFQVGECTVTKAQYEETV